MRRILIVISFLFVRGDAEAQQFSNAYLDSVKDFFKSWVESQNDFVYTVMDNPTDKGLLDIGVRRMEDGSIFELPYGKRKSYYLKYYPHSDYGSDSIIFSADELKLITDRIRESNSFHWTKDFFPSTDITDSSAFWSHYNDNKIRGTKPYYWSISLPIFLRNGQYAFLFSLYSCGGDCGYFELSLYKHENYWRRFDVLYWAMF